MKFFSHDRSSVTQTNCTVELETHVEPMGHVHPNYRHWAWFRPNNLHETKR